MCLGEGLKFVGWELDLRLMKLCMDDWVQGEVNLVKCLLLTCVMIGGNIVARVGLDCGIGYLWSLFEV